VKTDFRVGDISISLRPVEVGDDEFLYHVYASTRADEMALVDWTDEQKDAFLRMQVSAQTAHYSVHFPTAEQYIIRHNDVPVGRLIINRLPDRLHIIDIALLTDSRNTGIGSAVMQEIMDEAQQSKRDIMLRVEFFNPARRLYSRLGFVQNHEVRI
jgi:ribosomal protein S18 acetylase RimI-like enzyme